MERKEKKQEDKFTLMTTKPVERLVCELAIPTIITMLITAFYNMADTYFVSKIGTSATAAVGVVFPMMAIIQAMGFLFGQGSGNYMSRKLGEKKIEDAQEMATVGFFSAIIAGAVVCILGLLFINQIGNILGATPTILPYCRKYLSFILLGAPFMIASFVLNNQLRFQGNAMYGMIGMCTGALLNILLDPILIFVCDLGISGASIATSISQFLSMIILYVATNKKGIVKIKIKKFRPSRAIYIEILRGGVPALFRQSIASIAIICMNLFTRTYGDAAIAAMSIVTRVTMFAMSALIGFGQGFQPVCGFNYGAKLYKRVNQAFRFCITLSTAVLSVIAVTAFIFAPQIIGVFKTGDARVMDIGISALRYQCIAFPVHGFIIISNMMIQTIGKAVKASILAISRQGIFFIPALFILAPLFGLTGIKMVQPIADALTFMLSIPISFGVLKEMNQAVK